MVRAFHWQYGDIFLAIYFVVFTYYFVLSLKNKYTILYYTIVVLCAAIYRIRELVGENGHAFLIVIYTSGGGCSLVPSTSIWKGAEVSPRWNLWGGGAFPLELQIYLKNRISVNSCWIRKIYTSVDRQ